jgi:hypothetical protein
MSSRLRITSKNMTLRQSFLSDSSTLSLESLNVVALDNLIHNSSQQHCMFLQNVRRKPAPMLIASHISARNNQNN